jgi:N-acetyltransferase
MINFDFKSDYILEDERVLLRALTNSDYAHLLPFALAEPELWKYSMVSASGAGGMTQYIQTAIDQRNAENAYTFIVFDKRTNAYAGSTRFYDIQLDQSSTQLGYTWYGKAFQGTGLNRHCKLLLLQFAFEHLELDRVELRADNENKKSIAAMKRIGCQVEGVLRSHAFRNDGQRRDSIILSILRTDWFENVKTRITQQIAAGRETQSTGIIITTDKSRLDLELVHKYLSEESYWSQGIPFEAVQKAAANALTFIVLHENHQIGYARVISDYTTFAYLADVFILEAYRGKGLSKQLMAYIHQHPDLQGLRRWLLGTRDAHTLYMQFGWKPLAMPDRFMELHQPNVYAR